MRKIKVCLDYIVVYWCRIICTSLYKTEFRNGLSRMPISRYFLYLNTNLFFYLYINILSAYIIKEPTIGKNCFKHKGFVVVLYKDALYWVDVYAYLFQIIDNKVVLMTKIQGFSRFKSYKTEKVDSLDGVSLTIIPAYNLVLFY